MKNTFTIISLLSALLPGLAMSEIKVDLDKSGRNTSEVTEDGFTSWMADTNNSITIDGVSFSMSSLASSGSLSSNWYKAGVQSPYFAKLVCDCMYIKDCTGKDAGIQLTIKGLSDGTHTMLTYHNVVDDYSGKTLSPMDIYVNGTKVASNVVPSQRTLSTKESATAYFSFNVTNGGTTTIQFKAVSGNYNVHQVYLNGFAIDVPNTAMQATLDYPTNGDMHVDCDATKSVTLKWEAANGAKSHNVYCGTNESVVKNASTTSSEFIGNMTATNTTVKDLYSMNTYYWRVDEVDANGNVTKGDVWSFRPRILAFDGAEGYGKYSIGGRGGKVVYVTNLNDSGEGSFREAMTNDIGPRTIVFAVSGVIQLKERLTQAGKNVTIAAQTAPGRGICISAAPVGVGAESQCRFLRCRLGSGPTFDGLGMAGADNTITDHCSVSWTIDEAFSSRNAKNMTLQRTLISEALNIAGHKNYPEGTGHGYAATIGGDIASFHHNLLAHNQGRNWSMGGGLDGNGYYAGRLDIFNNVVYNWWHRVTDGGAHEVNFVGNYYKRGAASEQSNMDYMLSADLEGVGKGSQSYYFHNNIMAHQNGSLIHNGTDDTKGRRQTVAATQTVDWEVFQSKAFFPSYATVDNARNAYKSVLSDVGATMPVLDSHDLRMINETMNGTYSCTGAKSKVGGIIDASSESKEGDYSYYTSETRPAGFDTDMDGLPDWYETLIGTNPNSAKGDFSDSNADPDRDGYTNLEDYLKWMATPRAETKTGASAKFTLKDYFRAYTSSPTYTVSENKDNLKITINNGTANVTASTPGIHYFRITVKDSDNDSMTRLFAVYAEGKLNEIPTVNIVSPSNDTVITKAGQDIEVTVSASDKDGKIAKVEFYNGEELTNTATESPYKFTINDIKDGEYEIKAIAYDDQGATSEPASIKISVMIPRTLVYDNTENLDWTADESWNPSFAPRIIDTAIVRNGEVNVKNDIRAEVYVEKDGTIRVRDNFAIRVIHLQGGTIKSYTSNPQFRMSVTEMIVEEESVINAGSTEGSEFLINGVMKGDKDLTKTKQGILTLNVDASAFSGKWTLTEGKINIAKSDAIGTNGIVLKEGTTLIVSAETTTGDIEMEQTSKLTLDANLTVTTAMYDGKTISKGTYTSADLPDIITGDGSLIVLTGESSDIERNVVTDITLSPNPVSDILYITNIGDNETISITDASGKTVYVNKASGRAKVDISGMNEGVYVVKVGDEVMKVVKK